MVACFISNTGCMYWYTEYVLIFARHTMSEQQPQPSSPFEQSTTTGSTANTSTPSTAKNKNNTNRGNLSSSTMVLNSDDEPIQILYHNLLKYQGSDRSTEVSCYDYCLEFLNETQISNQLLSTIQLQLTKRITSTSSVGAPTSCMNNISTDTNHHHSDPHDDIYLNLIVCYFRTVSFQLRCIHLYHHDVDDDGITNTTTIPVTRIATTTTDSTKIPLTLNVIMKILQSIRSIYPVIHACMKYYNLILRQQYPNKSEKTMIHQNIINDTQILYALWDVVLLYYTCYHLQYDDHANRSRTGPTIHKATTVTASLTNTTTTSWMIPQNIHMISIYVCEYIQSCLYTRQYIHAFDHIQYYTMVWNHHHYIVPANITTTAEASNPNITTATTTVPSFKLTTTTTVEDVLRYYYLCGVVCIGCSFLYDTNHHRINIMNYLNNITTMSTTSSHTQISDVASPMSKQEYMKLKEHYISLGIRNLWICLSIPSSSHFSDDSSTRRHQNEMVSAISIAAYKKLILLQSLSCYGIFHTTITNSMEYTDATTAATTQTNISNHPNKIKMTPIVMQQLVQSTFSTNQHPYHHYNTNSSTPKMVPIPTCFNPLSTPKDMSSDLQRYISQAKSCVKSSTMSATVSAQPPVVSNERLVYPHYGIAIYKELVLAYIQIDICQFHTILQEHCHYIYHIDQNQQLIQSLQLALYIRYIYVCSSIYTSITLYDLFHTTDFGLCSDSYDTTTSPSSLLINTNMLYTILLYLQTEYEWPIQFVFPSSSSMEMQKDNIEQYIITFPSELPHIPSIMLNDMDHNEQPLHDLISTIQHLQTVQQQSKKYQMVMKYQQNKNMNTSGGTTNRY